MARWIQCPKTLKLIPNEEYHRHCEKLYVQVQGDIQPFRSPVDGTVIHSRTALRYHNEKHGVTDPRDYGPDYFKRKEKERNDALTSQGRRQKAARIEAINEALYRNGI
jgi:hypothetical protein